MSYSRSVKVGILKKVLPPESRNIVSISEETGISEQTIRSWIKTARSGSLDNGRDEKSPRHLSSSERVFSRLLSILMQKPSVIGLAATANLCTISHITVLAIAYFSSFVKEPDKIRFVKNFLPNF